MQLTSGRRAARFGVVLASVGCLLATGWSSARATGTGTLSPHPPPAFGSGDSSDVALGDLDGDGDLDAVVANLFMQPESVWLNDGTGTFVAHPTTPSFGTGHSYGVALGDLDGDGDLDAPRHQRRAAQYRLDERRDWRPRGSTPTPSWPTPTPRPSG